MWKLRASLSEAESRNYTGLRESGWKSVHSMEHMVIQLRPDPSNVNKASAWASSRGLAWVYAAARSDMPKSLFQGMGRGAAFARRSGGGIAITYHVFSDNKIEQAGKAALFTGLLSGRKLLPKKSNIGGPRDIFSRVAQGVKARCVIQVIAMDRSAYKGRSDGIYFDDSGRLEYNNFLNVLQDAGIINSDLVRKQQRRANRGGKGGMVYLGGDDDFEGDLADDGMIDL